MKRPRALIAGLAVVAAIGVIGSSAASAAPARTPAAKAQFKKLNASNAKFVKLAKRVATCPAAAPQLASARKSRAAAMKGAKTARLAKLRRSNATMNSAIMRLALAASKCGVAVPGAPGAVVVQPGDKSVVIQPGTPGTGNSSFLYDLTGLSVLDGLPIDLSALLGPGGTLPQVISLVPESELTSPVCTVAGTACVGIDAAQLQGVLSSASAGIPLVGPLLATITSKLGSGDLGDLLAVTRVSDTVVKVVPIGPLATLRALLGSLTGAPATSVVGHLSRVG